MFEKVLARFGSRKLADCALLFGFMTLTLVAITDMLQAYSEAKSKKQGRCASKGTSDIRAAEKSVEK